MAMVSTRFQEVYSLSSWYQDILKRYEQLAAWTAGSIVTPNCVWLPGLFNPKVLNPGLSSWQHATRLATLRS